jgi:hypothetical protein
LIAAAAAGSKTEREHSPSKVGMIAQSNAKKNKENSVEFVFD